MVRVEEDIPLDPLPPPPLRDAALLELEALLETLVEEKVVPPVVMTDTCVETWTLPLPVRLVVVFSVGAGDETLSLLLVDVAVCAIEGSETDAGVEEADEAVSEGAEVGVEDADTGVELSVGVSEGVEVSLVGVADMLAGVDAMDSAMLTGVGLNETRSLVTPPRSDSIPGTTELMSPPCRFLKIFTSNQPACVTAKNNTSIESKRI